MNNGFSGFDPSVLSNQVSRISTVYSNLMTAIGGGASSYVTNMSTKWCCNEAINFFSEGFKPAIDSILANIDICFESIVNSMNSAGNLWATRTNTIYTPVSFSPQGRTIDVSSIVENINGIRGIDASNATLTTNTDLNNILSNSTIELNNAISTVSNSVAFAGGNQADTLISTLHTIKSNLNNIITELKEEVSTCIANTVNEYGDVASQIAIAFEGE